MTTETKFQGLSTAFRVCHREPLNVMLHLVTTPVGLLCALSLLWHAHSAVPPTVVGLYLLSLLLMLPWRLWATTAVLTCALLYMSWVLEIGIVGSLVGIALSYAAQDLAHRLSDEPTFQSAYEKHPAWFTQLFEHNYFLLPLCLDAAQHARAAATLLSWLAPKSGLLRGRVDTPDDMRDLAVVRDWVEEQNPATDVTAHWWTNALEGPVRDTVARLAESRGMFDMFHARYDKQLFAVTPVHEMNEVYVASNKHRNSSDAVFYTQHIDGPFMVYPFAAVYRCILAVNENVQIRTAFPMTPTGVTLTTGDVGGFDFNREIHRIEHNPGAHNLGRRITLKLHYCVYPKRLQWYGRLLQTLTTRYDTAARDLFLKTLRPKKLIERFLSHVILLSTKAYRVVAEHVGGGSIAYLGALAAVDSMVEAPVFLYGSSFIHYLLYMAVYYTREDVAFITFKRRAVFWKGLAAAQLVYLYASAGVFAPLSFTLIVMGLALSSAAARVLGIERTYFAAELGLCEPLTLRRFPYNVIRHPMIVGNIIALAGFYALPEFRTAAPYLVPLHVAFYLLHLLQEQGLILRNPRHGKVAAE